MMIPEKRVLLLGLPVLLLFAVSGLKQPIAPVFARAHQPSNANGRQEVMSQPEVERLSPEADAIFPKHPQIQKVVSGFKWNEGPVWTPAGDLLFADIPGNSIQRLSSSDQVTDPPYGLSTQSDSDPAKELAFSGVYRIPNAQNQPAGTPPDREHLQLLLKDLPRPNGIVFSPDEKYLYVDNSGPQKFWMRYRVEPDGSLTDGILFHDATSDPRPGTADGMKVDEAGNLYSAAPGGVWIFSPSGKRIATLDIPEQVGNLAWGGVNGRTLYIAASGCIYRVNLKIHGVRPRIQ
jgi:sugar lactone lactonase YvrE